MQSVTFIHKVGGESGNGGEKDCGHLVQFNILAANSRTNCNLCMKPSVKICHWKLKQKTKQNKKTWAQNKLLEFPWADIIKQSNFDCGHLLF
jgi:hypothetical protein